MDINHLEKFKNTIASGKTGNGALTGAPLEVMAQGGRSMIGERDDRWSLR
ncbi:MAG: hypothetical protein IJV93_03440 [Lentisphaeria bacterium]|nr:hypothetical protein [Lentisphaeria bacterium]